MNQLGLFKLTAFAIGTTLASGIFSISKDMAANGAGTMAVLIGWVIAGVGMFALSMCFNRLSIVRPDLKSGIFAYAKEGFGEYIGFNAAWGYWLSAILSQVSFCTLLFAAVGHFFPAFGDGNNLLSVVCASGLIWLFTLFILGGVQQAVTINTVIVIAKVIPILVFIITVILLGAFDFSTFIDNFRGEDTGLSLGKQVLETTYSTVWIFTGIEGAIVISGRAKSTSTAGKATAISFLSLLVLYVVISLLSIGIMPRAELATLKDPGMATLMASIVGPWGSILINIGVIISIAGAMFSYVILTADAAYAPAVMKCFPKFLTIENSKHAPAMALLTTTFIIQVFLIVVYFQAGTYQVCYTLSTSAIMIPFFLSALYCLKVTMDHRRLTTRSAGIGVWVISIVGTIYGAWLLIATGVQNILISALLYGPGVLLYGWSKMENKEKLFPTAVDLIAFIVICIGFVVSLFLIVTGRITLF
ncbi:MAG: basic amino acid/polyamine antiporter [Anaerovoracaceae bacterium]